MNRNETLGNILYRGIVPVLVQDKLPLMRCLEAVLEADITAVEISCRHPEALSVIREAKRSYPGLALGAATLVEDGRVRDHLNARGTPVPSIAEVVEAGADFLVSLLPFRQPTFERYAQDLVIISGVVTPGEAQQALDWGANLVKYSNPHLLGGPDFFKGQDPATYRAFPYYVTGGMRSNISAGYIEAGVLALGAGLEMMLGPEYVALQGVFDPYAMNERLREYTRDIDLARQRHQPHVPFATKDPQAIQEACGRCLNV